MKVLTLISRIFAVVGAALLLLALYQAHSTHRFLARATELSGEVTDLLPIMSSGSSGMTYKAEIHYDLPDGTEQRLVTGFSSNPPAYDVGEAVSVLHDPSGEREPQVRGFMSLWGGALISGVLGAAFFAIGGGMIAWGWRKGRLAEHLLAHGQPVEALVQGVELNGSLTVNGKHPFVVICQWLHPQTNEVHVFRSENLWFDPTPHLDRERVRVFIEPGNPRRYLVDLSFLPRLAQ